VQNLGANQEKTTRGAVQDATVENMLQYIVSQKVLRSTSEMFRSLKLRRILIHFSLKHAPLTNDPKQMLAG